jgi:hypothetical protein
MSLCSGEKGGKRTDGWRKVLSDEPFYESDFSLGVKLEELSERKNNPEEPDLRKKKRHACAYVDILTAPHTSTHLAGRDTLISGPAVSHCSQELLSPCSWAWLMESGLGTNQHYKVKVGARSTIRSG